MAGTPVARAATVAGRAGRAGGPAHRAPSGARGGRRPGTAPVPEHDGRTALLGGRPLAGGARPLAPAARPVPSADGERGWTPRSAPAARPATGTARHARRRTATPSAPSSPSSSSGRFLFRAAVVTAALTAVGAVLGLVRDQILARYFGAGAETDAFLVAWTVPEFASTLLIEDAMALILVPAFSHALARRSGSLFGDPVRALVRATLPRLVLAVAAVSALLVVTAPLLVSALAPGLPDPRLAVDCTRLTATCVLSFALAGYCSAALRAHDSFLPPAAIYVAYNIGIIGTILVLREPFGVRAAAAGVAVGGVLMVLVQAPSLVRELRTRPVPKEEPVPVPAGDGRLLVLGMIAPVIVFALTRQSQILIERFLASPLPAGAISHLNYAQKVAQMPMILSLMLCTVSFPVVARALAAGEAEAARRRVERDLLLAAVVVLIGASTVIAAAPQIVQLLFQRGAFDASDTSATATVMRVYALGLLGQTMVGALVRCYFSAARPLWYPAAAMATGLAVTGLAGTAGAHLWGAAGIAGANALGITVTAVMLLLGAHRQSVPIDVRHLGEGLLRLTTAGAWATGAGWLCSVAIGPPVLAVTVAALVVVGVFVLFIGCAAKAPEIPPLPRSACRRTPHARRRAASNAADATPVGGDVPLDRGQPR
ncbi:lipid II flippase MurJ [Streptomyces sp. NPDC046374]|uniref:lipid II flippase MurJ n=1 Tax=Streptomyces sp. NPDC046374 TaxID=3154917 RepID=UPI0034045C68